MFFDKCHRWTRGQLRYLGFEAQVYNQVPTAAVILILKSSGENYKVCRKKQKLNRKKALMLVGAGEEELA